MGWLTYYFAANPADLKFLQRVSPSKFDFLISFAEVVENPSKVPFDLIKARRSEGHRVMLDSGAFTNFARPGTVRFEQYREFIKSEHKHFDEYVTFDDLRSRRKTIKNWLELRKDGLHPLFVDHLWMSDHEVVRNIWKRESKLCMSMWAKTASHHERFPTTPKERLPVRVKMAREVRTKAHLLACGSLTKMIPHADVVHSVDSAAWDRATAFRRVLFLESRPFGGINLPVVCPYAMPGTRNAGKNKQMSRDHIAAARAFAKRIGWKKELTGQFFSVFNVDQLTKYQKALNDIAQHKLVAAAARHEEERKKIKCAEVAAVWGDGPDAFDADLEYVESAMTEGSADLALGLLDLLE